MLHVLCRFSHVQLCATLWTLALQAPLSMGILQARILESVTMPSSKASSLEGSYHMTLQSHPGYISGEKYGLKGYRLSSFHCNTVYNSQDMEAA